jgi:hypothetical protein
MVIAGTERCGGTGQIDVAADVHVEPSHAKGFDATVENHAKCTDAIEKDQICK